MRKLLLLLLLLFCFSTQDIYAQSRYNLLYEPLTSIQFGAENLMGAHYLWKTLDNRYIPTQLFKAKTKKAKRWNRLYRFGKLFLIDYPITFMMPSIQHERFGHGGRVLEFRGNINFIKVTLPPPFQFDFPGISYNNGLVSDQQGLMVAAGGSEANTVMGNLLRRNILLDGELDYHAAFMYLYANNDLTGYTGFASQNGFGDINAFIGLINNFYGEEALTIERLQRYSYASILLDPMNYYAFYSIFKGYVYDGKISSPISLIRINDRIQYLPKLRFALAPYGVEIIYQNYFKFENQLASVDIAHSDGTYAPSFRLSLNTWNTTLTNKLSFHLSTHYWYQPQIEIIGGRTVQTFEGHGGAALFTFFYDFIQKDDNLFGATLQVGYKTKGFLEGEMLGDGLILRGGVSFDLKRG